MGAGNLRGQMDAGFGVDRTGHDLRGTVNPSAGSFATKSAAELRENILGSHGRASV